ncbi:hypothetical protein GW758_00845 [Candidatus Falkowbacteria bacterium]|nr:hypothetical protein [Candidatus Falkowbacteria bacterium]
MKKRKVRLKALLFIVLITTSLGNYSKANSNVKSSEELKAGQQFFTNQDENQLSKKISSFAYLENSVFQFQINNISARAVGGTDETFIGKETAVFGHALDAVWVSPFCVNCYC